MTEVNTSDEIMPAREAGVGPNKNSVFEQRSFDVYYTLDLIRRFTLKHVRDRYLEGMTKDVSAAFMAKLNNQMEICTQ